MRYLPLLLVWIFLSGCAKLEPPTDVYAVAVNDSTIKIEWREWSDGEEGYLVLESIGNGQFEIATRVPAESVSATLEHRKPGGSYRYQVAAIKGHKRGPASQSVSLNTPVTLPQAPLNLVATPYSVSQINLAWQDVSSSESGFIIERKPEDSSWHEVGRVGAGQTAWSDRELLRGTTYFYRVRGFAPAGKGEYSNETMATTTLSPEVTVIYPNGGEVLTGPELTIRYKADPMFGGVIISFYTADNFWFKAKRWAKNDGVFLFKDFSSLMESKTYKVRIATNDPASFDESDDYFEVKKP